ncbi:MAG: hypothetical protein HC913_22475 [Microscillaceae bacterium]|nr:hypothetical protein [Microscillaceae bacterium]
MKNLRNLALTLTFFVALLSVAQAQTTAQVPSEGFELAFSQNQFQLNAGETANFKVQILRSKAFRKANIELVAVALPEGLEVVFSPSAEADTYDAVLRSTTALANGRYSLTILGKSQFCAKVNCWT